MPVPIMGLYNSFQMSDEELKVARSLNILQKCWLQNIQYELVLRRDRLEINMQHPQEYFYQKAQLDGRIDQLTELINTVPEEPKTTEV